MKLQIKRHNNIIINVNIHCKGYFDTFVNYHI